MSNERNKLAVVMAVAISCGWVLACGGDSPPPRAEVSVGEAYDAWKAEDPPIFLDVRSETEYLQAHIEGSVHIPHTEVARRIEELRALGEPRVIVYCERGGRASVAEEALAGAGGFEVQHMQGDMRGWRRADLPVIRAGG